MVISVVDALIQCLLLLLLSVGCLVWSLFCNVVLVPFPVSNHLTKEERAACFTLIVFLLACVYL